MSPRAPMVTLLAVMVALGGTSFAAPAGGTAEGAASAVKKKPKVKKCKAGQVPLRQKGRSILVGRQAGRKRSARCARVPRVKGPPTLARGLSYLDRAASRNGLDRFRRKRLGPKGMRKGNRRLKAGRKLLIRSARDTQKLDPSRSIRAQARATRAAPHARSSAVIERGPMPNGSGTGTLSSEGGRRTLAIDSGERDAGNGLTGQTEGSATTPETTYITTPEEGFRVSQAEIGQVTSTNTTISAGKAGDRSRVTTGYSDGGFVQSCPGPGGLADGTQLFATRLGSVEERGGFRVKTSVEHSVKSKFRANVADDARAKTYSLRAEFEQEIRGNAVRVPSGKLFSHGPTRVYRGFIEHPSLTLERPGRATIYEQLVAGLRSGVASGNMRGPKGLDESALVAFYLGIAFVESPEPLILDAEQYWYGEGDKFGPRGSAFGACVKVAHDPSVAEVRSGERKVVRTSVRANSDGAQVPARHTVIPRTGTVSPGSASSPSGAPVDFAWTAPADADSFSSPFPTFQDTATSNRGRTIWLHNARVPKSQDFAVSFAGSVDVQRHEDYSTGSGDFTWDIGGAGSWRVGNDRVRIEPGARTDVKDPCEFGGGPCQAAYDLDYARSADYDDPNADDYDLSCTTGGSVGPDAANRIATGFSAVPQSGGDMRLSGLSPSFGWEAPCTGGPSPSLEWRLPETFMPSCAYVSGDPRAEIRVAATVSAAALKEQDVITVPVGNTITTSCNGGPASFTWSGTLTLRRLGAR